YDPLLNWLGISKNHYYRVGHAAVVLVNGFNGSLQYFDFGRYHSPFGYGRVRSEATDPELKMNQKAQLVSRKIMNLNAILLELYNRKACHGEGNLFAAVLSIDFEKAYKKAILLQQNSPTKYGPFVWKGSNCSRFVNDVVRAGRPSFWPRWQLMFPLTLSSTPLGNVKAAGKWWKIPGIRPDIPSCQNDLSTVLPAPKKHPLIPPQSCWLSGEGAGSWFHISRMSELFIVRRFSPDGDLEFSRVFEATGNNFFYPQTPYMMEYLSHFEKITIIQAGKLIVLEPISRKYSLKAEMDGIRDLLDKLKLISN
ncbi:MAG: hypothetical protein M3512_17285, partial [Bacteroidota bacterium]|nr:hypothetical protein [Bacteroidota bacterium]